jgi:signal transduction histidine kinase
MSKVLGDALRRFDLSAQRIEFVAPPELPLCLGHAPWLEEVFANFLSNAIKYIGEANPQPTIAVVGIVQGRHARYEVRDNGIGIPAAQQATIFEHFTRLSNAGHIKGSGLGLSIVQRIVAKLKGRVGLESQPGQGSTFWFELPHAADPWA